MKIEKVNIALAGFGNIGSYFYRILDKNKTNISIKTGKIPFIKYISAKNINKKRNIKIPRTKWVKNPLNLVFKEDVDIIVELIGGSEGAGPGPTSSALISDLCSILKGEINFPFGVSSYLRKKIPKFNILNHLCSSYLRIEVKDQPGVLSSITKSFAKNKISIKNLIQRPNKKNKKASIIIITHENLEKNFNNLLSLLNKNKFVLKKPTFIRIEAV